MGMGSTTALRCWGLWGRHPAWLWRHIQALRDPGSYSKADVYVHGRLTLNPCRHKSRWVRFLLPVFTCLGLQRHCTPTGELARPQVGNGEQQIRHRSAVQSS